MFLPDVLLDQIALLGKKHLSIDFDLFDLLHIFKGF